MPSAMSSGRSWNHDIDAFVTIPKLTAGGTTMIAARKPAITLNARNCKKSPGRRRERVFLDEAIHSVYPMKL